MPENDIRELAARARSFFERGQRANAREDEYYWRMKDKLPIWVHDLTFKAHDNGNILPDDYKYEYIVDALDRLEDGHDPESPELEADVYNNDLVRWLGSLVHRADYVDEGVEDYGWDEEGGIMRAIAMGQIREREEIFYSVVESLKERLEAIENGDPEVFKKHGKSESVLDWEPEK